MNFKNQRWAFDLISGNLLLLKQNNQFIVNLNDKLLIILCESGESCVSERMWEVEYIWGEGIFVIKKGINSIF